MQGLVGAAMGDSIALFDGRAVEAALAGPLPHGESPPRQGDPKPLAAPVGLLRPGWGEVWAGVDEAGRGPLAGPVVACALVPPRRLPVGLADSKALAPARRSRICRELLEASWDVRVAVAPSRVVDQHNVRAASLQAMAAAAAALQAAFDCLWVDGPDRLPLPGGLHQHPVPDADAAVGCVAAASVVAKVVRDAIMAELDRLFPGYGFARHKGYPTPEHLRALTRLGPSPVHRLSFQPLRRQGAAG